jgi:hypothetical protein
MQFDFVILADYAEIANGKLYLMGGGWDTFTAPQAPVAIRLAVAVGVRIGWEETNRPTPVVIAVVDDDGREYIKVQGELRVGRPPQLAPGSGQLASLAANLPLTVQKFGGYSIDVIAGPPGEEVHRSVPFRIQQGGAAAPPPGT